jgi:hypothetical protein
MTPEHLGLQQCYQFIARLVQRRISYVLHPSPLIDLQNKCVVVRGEI